MVYAQQTYFLETLQGPYQALQDATVLTDGIIWDDPKIPVALPFPFTIGGNVLDSIYIYDYGLSSENQLLDIDAANVNASNLSAILAIGADLVDRAEHDGGSHLSPISYKTITENDKQVFVIEFKNAGFYDEEFIIGPSQDFVNFQIRLVDDNSIEYHYGESHISDPEEYFYNSGSIAALIPSYDIDSIGEITFSQDIHVLSNDPNNPDLELVNTSWLEMIDGLPVLDAYPENGTKYIFSLDDPSLGQKEWSNNDFSIVNPAQETLVYKHNNAVIDHIEILNQLGKVVLTTPSVHQVDISILTSGIYYVEFYNGNSKIATKKMIKS